MVSKIKHIKSVENIFSSWEESIIWSCLDGTMGEIYTDSVENPISAMAILGDFIFFAGQPNKEIVYYKPDNCTREFIIMVPENKEWEYLIEECYKERAKKVTRYAIKKEGNVFDKDKLQKVVNSVPEGFEIKLIDENIYNKCKREYWSKDLVAQYEDYKSFYNNGLGVVIMKDEEILSGASSYSRYKEGIEIEIDTKENYRRRGLAYICGAKLILECLKRNLYPSWDAQNKDSVALAEKLGYHYSHSYDAYEIWKY